jgi:multidrug efflux pump
MEAARKGSEEIFFAVISTSVTLAVVFLPIIFLQGFVGRLFREFGIVMSGAILISAFVSLSLTPVLNVKLARKNHKHSRFYERTEPFFVNMTESYRRTLQGFVRHRERALGILFGCILLIFGIGFRFEIGISSTGRQKSYQAPGNHSGRKFL